jgi:hypothetical protein
VAFLAEAIRQYTAHLEGYNLVFSFLISSWLGRSFIFINYIRGRKATQFVFKELRAADRAVELK